MGTTVDNYRIWIISEGNSGHYNQSAAIAEVIAASRGGATEWIEARLKLRGFLRPLLAWLLNAWRGRMPDALMRLTYRLHEALPAGAPDLIISSGGKSAFLNVMLARATGARNLFIGPPPGLACRNFTAVLTLEEDARCGNCLVMDALPTRVTPERATEQGRQFIEENHLAGQRLWCMLIGGSSRSHRYTAADWRQLAQAMDALAERHRIKWLVTTSRRTGSECETMLRATLRPERIADAVYWGEAPRKVVLKYLGASEVVFCTQDSLTMITEAMASGKPVYAVHPRTVSLAHESARFYRQYLARNIELGRLRAVPMDGLAQVDVEHDMTHHFKPTREPLTTPIAAALLPVLIGVSHVQQ